MLCQAPPPAVNLWFGASRPLQLTGRHFSADVLKYRGRATAETDRN
jgi:hypothetical protein